MWTQMRSSFVFSPRISSDVQLETITQKPKTHKQCGEGCTKRGVSFHPNHKAPKSKAETNSLKPEVSNFKFYSVFGAPEIDQANAWY